MIWFVLILAWAFWASMLINNFEDYIIQMPWWKARLLELILILGAGFFFVSEMLEILINIILGEGE